MKNIITNNSGIYSIANFTTGKRYYGSASNLNRRRARHLTALRRGIHYNSYLQNAWNKHGEFDFAFEILELVSKENLIIYEQKYLDIFCGKDTCYNILSTAGSSVGYQHSKKTKEHLSKNNKRPFKGCHHSEEVKEIISKNNKGLKRTEETRRKISENHADFSGPNGPLYGRPSPFRGLKLRTEEQKKKLSLERTGPGNPMYGTIPITAKSTIAQNALTKEIIEFTSIESCAKHFNVSRSHIRNCSKSEREIDGFVISFHSPWDGSKTNGYNVEMGQPAIMKEWMEANK